MRVIVIQFVAVCLTYKLINEHDDDDNSQSKLTSCLFNADSQHLV